VPSRQRKVGRKGGVVSPFVVDYIAVLVVTGWVILLIADVLVKDYKPDKIVHLIAGGLLGSIFGFRILTSKNGNE
jgi:hypothetical protein